MNIKLRAKPSRIIQHNLFLSLALLLPLTAVRADFPFAGEYYGVTPTVVNGITRMELPFKLVMMPDGKSGVATMQGPNSSWATPVRGKMTGPLTFTGKSDAKRIRWMKVLDGGEDTFQFSKDGSTITIRPKPWLTGLKSPPVILYRKGTKMADQTQNRYPALLSQAKRASGTMNLRHSDVEVANYNRIPPDLAKEARFVEGSFILKRDLLYAYNGERLPSGEPKLDFSRPAISLAPGDLPPNVWNGTIFHVDKRNNDVISLPHRGSPVREGKLIKLKP